MAAWTNDELDRIDAAQELTLASARGDGTLRRPVTMWVVRVGQDVCVRSVNGRGSAWFRRREHEGPCKEQNIWWASSPEKRVRNLVQCHIWSCPSKNEIFIIVLQFVQKIFRFSRTEVD